MAKKYYWLKLKEDFFEEKQIRYLRKLPDGDKLVIAYLKMQLKSLRTEGFIKYDQIMPNNEEELAMILDEDINIVKLMLQALLQVKAIEILDDGSFYMIALQELIGKDGESTERVRKFRERQLKRQNIELQFVRKLSNEQIALPDGSFRFFDNKRYGGNAEYVYDLAMCKCECCGESDGTKLLIHHNNGCSNDLEDLYLLCKKCHANVENGNIILTKHNRRSVTCNANVTECNTEIEKEKEKEIEKKKDKESVQMLQQMYNKSTPEIEKNKKEKKSTEIDDLINSNFTDEELKNTVYEFIKMRKAIKKPLTTRGLELMIKKLYKLTTNIDEQIEILNNSIMNNWQGIFPLKNNATKNKGGFDDFKEIWEEARLQDEQAGNNTDNNSFGW